MSIPDAAGSAIRAADHTWHWNPGIVSHYLSIHGPRVLVLVAHVSFELPAAWTSGGEMQSGEMKTKTGSGLNRNHSNNHRTAKWLFPPEKFIPSFPQVSPPLDCGAHRRFRHGIDSISPLHHHQPIQPSGIHGSTCPRREMPREVESPYLRVESPENAPVAGTTCPCPPLDCGATRRFCHGIDPIPPQKHRLSPNSTIHRSPTSETPLTAHWISSG
jgi:hypothetical protein